MVVIYVRRIQQGTMNLEDVPERWRNAVFSVLNHE